MDKQPYIVGVGAANADLNGASLAPIHLRDSNPGHISLSAGGVTRNVCENLARLGADVKLLSCVGDDTFGAFIRRSCEDAGIDASHLYEAKGANSSMYLSILDADGDMLVGMSDMRIVQQDMPEDYLPSQKALIQGAGIVLMRHLLIDLRYNGQFRSKHDVVLPDGRQLDKLRTYNVAFSFGYLF